MAIVSPLLVAPSLNVVRTICGLGQIKPAPDPASPQVRGRFRSTSRSRCRSRARTPQAVLAVVWQLGKTRSDLRNAVFARWPMSADFGLERISCGIPAESDEASMDLE